MKVSINKTQQLCVCVIILTFFLELWAPATSGSTLSDATFKEIIKYVYFILAGILAVFMMLFHKVTDTSLLVSCTPLFLFLLGSIWRFEDAPRMVSLSSCLICFFYSFQSNQIRYQVYILIKRLLILMSVIGIILYLVFLFRIPIPYSLVSYYAGTSSEFYVDYKICYFYYNRVNDSLRLCGLFNEPGWFGTFLAFLLCCENLNLKKIENIAILIAGFLTFSIAFIIIIGVYFILTNISSWRRCILAIILIVVYLFVLPNIETSSPQINSVISRLTITEEGLQGNNRTTALFDKVYNEEIKSPQILIGKGSGYSKSVSGKVLSIKTFILDYGFLGTFFIFAPIYIILIYKNRGNIHILNYLICNMLSLYQRPWTFEVANYIFLLSSISFLSLTYSPTLKNDLIKITI